MLYKSRIVARGCPPESRKGPTKPRKWHVAPARFRQLADEGTFHYPVQEFREELLLKLKRGA